MDNEVLIRFIDMAQAAAQKVGMEGARVWPQVVGITYIQSIVYVATALAVIVITPIFALIVNARIQGDIDARIAANAHGDWTTGKWFTRIILTAFTVLFVAVAASSLPDNVPGVFFPEAKTILNIIASTKR